MLLLNLVMAACNLAFAAGDAVLVLLAGERLGLGAVGYGLLLAISGVGTALGGVCTARLSGCLGRARALHASSAVCATGTLVLAASTTPVVAAPALATVGFAFTVTNAQISTLRQALTPTGLLGRVVSKGRLPTWGLVPLGAVLGGLLGRLDIRAPFIGGAAVFCLVTLVATMAVTQRRLDEATGL